MEGCNNPVKTGFLILPENRDFFQRVAEMTIFREIRFSQIILAPY
jgi:hypothetical protein